MNLIVIDGSDFSDPSLWLLEVMLHMIMHWLGASSNFTTLSHMLISPKTQLTSPHAQPRHSPLPLPSPILRHLSQFHHLLSLAKLPSNAPYYPNPRTGARERLHQTFLRYSPGHNLPPLPKRFPRFLCSAVPFLSTEWARSYWEERSHDLVSSEGTSKLKNLKIFSSYRC